MHGFEELRSIRESSGKSLCPKCGNISFKIPAIFTPKIFKKREFADGTQTPDHVNTHSQEKDWMKAEGIVFDSSEYTDIKFENKKRKKRESKTAMENAFKKAVNKCEQGFKVEGTKQKEVKKTAFSV